MTKVVATTTVLEIKASKDTFSTQKRITIPKNIAEAMELIKGEQLLLEYENGELKVKKIK